MAASTETDTTEATTKNSTDNTITIAYMNIRGQTGLDISKQVQIEHFLKTFKIDILNCQEINITEDSFIQTNFIGSSYQILSNNATNKYGTACLISNNFTPQNIKLDTKGRLIVFDIENITLCNLHLPSGNDAIARASRENYLAETIPSLLVNTSDNGCIGGDWNCIENKNDATKNAANKVSPCLKRLIKNFSWTDSFRLLHPQANTFSRYYDSSLHGEGATRIDRQYHYGGLEVVKADYVAVAFSDHLSLIVQVKVPYQLSRLICPKSKPLFKSKPEVIEDKVFLSRLKENYEVWSEVKSFGLDVMSWWELLVKPGIKRLLIERGKEMVKQSKGELNFLLLRQAYLVRKVQSGQQHRLGELFSVQHQIEAWYKQDCQKIKLQARAEELNKAEPVRIYHHELHKKKIKRTSILKLETESGIIQGHKKCTSFLENSISDLLLHPAKLSVAAQDELLAVVNPVFTEADNALLKKAPTKNEVKESVWSSNLHAAPGTDGLTTYLYYFCWDILGDPLTEVIQTVHKGSPPTSSQRTSMMVFGTKPKKPNSIKVSDKRRISLLNSDFKVMTGVESNRFRKVATHTLSPCQLAAGEDRRIHHGINKARDAITAAGDSKECVGILDNDYKAAFDYMALHWVLKVLKAKGLDQSVINRLTNIYSNNYTIVVVNNILGRSFPNNYWSIRQGDRPSSGLFCYGIDPHLVWLERRLRGIPIYKQLSHGPALPGKQSELQLVETYKVIGYVDDIKPAITSMHEFTVVDQGSSLFEAASGCILHRDPRSGKVKFLPLGRWKGTLQQEDLPVKYVALSDHLDMVGVQLKATYTQTRKLNCDTLLEKVGNTIGPWKGGKFMPLTMRPFSINTYCMSKLLFRSGSIDLRQGDIRKITSDIKSWLFADQLEYPEEFVLYRPRSAGGLGLLNVKFKCIAEQIRSFLETAINPTFTNNLYHQALFKWHVEGNHDIPPPKKNPYLSEEFFEHIREVKEEGLLNLAKMTSGSWYKVLLENNVIMETATERILKPCKAEIRNPTVDWELSWSLANMDGLCSSHKTFLWKMLHNVLPTQERLNKMGMRNAPSPLCTNCSSNQLDSPSHALISCPLNKQVSDWLLKVLQPHVPNILPTELVLLELGSVDDAFKLPVVWMIAEVLGQIWLCRKEKKKPQLFQTRAVLEAGIEILRRTRFTDECSKIETIINSA